MLAAQLTLSKEPDREEIIVNTFFVMKVALQENKSSWRRFFSPQFGFLAWVTSFDFRFLFAVHWLEKNRTLVLTLSNLVPLGNINHYANQKSYNRGTQPPFSVKYLFGEANIAKD